MKRIYNILSLLLISNAIFSQNFISIKGKIINEIGLPIAYANIGIINKNIGTMSEISGLFSLRIPKNLLSDTLNISHVSFTQESIPISDLIDNNDSMSIRLKEKVLLLNELKISAKKSKLIKKGVKFVNPVIWAHSQSEEGNMVEMTTLIDNNFKRIYLQKANMYIQNIPYDSCIIRLNIYKSVNKMPSENIVNTNNIYPTKLHKGWCSIDISNLKLTINEPIFVSFELIPLNRNSKLELFLGGKFGVTSYRRNVTLGKWEIRFDGKAGYAINVEGYRLE